MRGSSKFSTEVSIGEKKVDVEVTVGYKNIEIEDIDNIVQTVKQQLVDNEVQNLVFENKMMGDFLQSLGLSPDTITSYVINGSKEERKPENIFPSTKIFDDDFVNRLAFQHVLKTLKLDELSTEAEIFFVKTKGGE